MTTEFRAAYLELGLDELRDRARRALEGLTRCRVCPRDCDVNRLEDRWGACKTGRLAVVTSAFPHMGEEDCLRGSRGSGTIFFAHCNLRCVFCQNYDISQGLEPGPLRRRTRRGPGTGGGGRPGRSTGTEMATDTGTDTGTDNGNRTDTGTGGRGRWRLTGTRGTPPEELARLMISLQERGCHNINFVTPEHVVPQVLEALVLAVEEGLRLPLVYNTSAYDAMESLELLDGVVDIYMPDLKLFDPDRAERYLKARDYPEAAKQAVKEMHRQVGFLRTDHQGVALRGVLIRHLVMPGLPEETEAILTWIARELGPETYVNVMAQYRPGGRVGGSRYPELDRPLDPREYREALEAAARAGLTRLDERKPKLRWF